MPALDHYRDYASTSKLSHQMNTPVYDSRNASSQMQHSHFILLLLTVIDKLELLNSDEARGNFVPLHSTEVP